MSRERQSALDGVGDNVLNSYVNMLVPTGFVGVPDFFVNKLVLWSFVMHWSVMDEDSVPDLTGGVIPLGVDLALDLGDATVTVNMLALWSFVLVYWYVMDGDVVPDFYMNMLALWGFVTVDGDRGPDFGVNMLALAAPGDTRQDDTLAFDKRHPSGRDVRNQNSRLCQTVKREGHTRMFGIAGNCLSSYLSICMNTRLGAREKPALAPLRAREEPVLALAH